MTAGSEMRVSDSEREAAAAELREHFASGRLTQDEMGERLDAAFAARTRGDLSALFADLPSARPGPGPGWAGQPAGTGWTGTGWTGTGWTGNRPGGDAGPRWQYRERPPGGPGWHGDARRPAPGRAGGAAIFALFLLMPVLLAGGMLALFGAGGGRPFGIVLIIAALAVLRRLLFAIFGRRSRRPGPRRRRW